VKAALLNGEIPNTSVREVTINRGEMKKLTSTALSKVSIRQIAYNEMQYSAKWDKDGNLDRSSVRYTGTIFKKHKIAGTGFFVSRKEMDGMWSDGIQGPTGVIVTTVKEGCEVTYHIPAVGSYKEPPIESPSTTAVAPALNAALEQSLVEARGQLGRCDERYAQCLQVVSHYREMIRTARMQGNEEHATIYHQYHEWALGQANETAEEQAQAHAVTVFYEQEMAKVAANVQVEHEEQQQEEHVSETDVPMMGCPFSRTKELRTTKVGKVKAMRRVQKRKEREDKRVSVLRLQKQGVAKKKACSNGYWCDKKGCERFFRTEYWLKKHQKSNRCPDGGTNPFRCSLHKLKSGAKDVTPVYVSSSDLMKMVIGDPGSALRGAVKRKVHSTSASGELTGDLNIDSFMEDASHDGRYHMPDGSIFFCPRAPVGLYMKKARKGEVARYTTRQVEFLRWCYSRGVMEKACKMSAREAESYMKMYGSRTGRAQFPQDPYWKKGSSKSFRLSERLTHWTFRSWFSQQKGAFDKKLANAMKNAVTHVSELPTTHDDDNDDDDDE